MDSENNSFVDAIFNFWGGLETPTKLLISGTLGVWLIWIIVVATTDQTVAEEAFLPAVSASGEEAAGETNEVFLPQVNDESNSTSVISGDLARGATQFIIEPAQSVASYYVEQEFFKDSGLVVGRNTNLGHNVAVGSTRALSGSFALDLEKGSPKLIGGEFTADLSQLTSVQPHRDETIKKYWLQSNRYPTATFEVTFLPNLPADYAEGAPIAFPLTGNLTVREIEQEVIFDVVATLEGQTLEVFAVTEVMFEDFGMDPPNMAGVLQVEDTLKLIISLTAVAQD